MDKALSPRDVNVILSKSSLRPVKTCTDNAECICIRVFAGTIRKAVIAKRQGEGNFCNVDPAPVILNNVYYLR